VAAPLVKGVLDQGAMSVIYGDSNVGKSFVVIDMAFSVAAGVPWAGHKTAGLPVVYIAAEGGRGVLKRIRALEHKYGRPAVERAPFRLLPSPVDLLHADADLVPLTQALAAVKAELGGLGLVVVDTLSRALAGGDENTSTDMGGFVKNIDKLRTYLECHLTLIHHTGKRADKGARGWSGLRAAIDTEIELEPGRDRRDREATRPRGIEDVRVRAPGREAVEGRRRRRRHLGHGQDRAR
jgi:RecA-family ATPase